MRARVFVYLAMTLALCARVAFTAAEPRLTPAEVRRLADTAARQQTDLRAYTRGQPSFDPVSKNWGVNYRLKASAPDSPSRGILSVSVSDTTGFASTRFWLATPTPPIPARTQVRASFTLPLVLLGFALALFIFAVIRQRKLKRGDVSSA
jgi:hypothetical protein